MSDFESIIANTTAGRGSRDFAANQAVANVQSVALLCQHAFNPESELHREACMILDLVAEKNLDAVQPHLDDLTKSLSKVTDQTSIRSLSRICIALAKSTMLTSEQRQRITESSFDWLIGNHKVAAKSNAIYTLMHLSKHEPWIAGELVSVIDKDFADGTAAYKAAAKRALKKLKVK